MEIGLAEAGLAATLASVTAVWVTVRMTRRRDDKADQELAHREALEEGKRRNLLQAVADDVDNIMTREIPRIGRLETMVEGTLIAVKALAESQNRTQTQIDSLASLERKRSDSLERILNHILEAKGGA
jgi:uncharacterized membrane protein YhiD involved in acid resistance